jgi:predicted Fe-Mo cluster-binding NifX family protein
MAVIKAGGIAGAIPGTTKTIKGYSRMKFAVTSQGSDLSAQVDPRFGRTRFFLVVDPTTGQQTVLNNEAGMNAAQGAGIQAVQTLANLGVQAVVTGHVGPKAWTALQAANISVYAAAEGTVEQAMKAFMAKQLQPMTSANVQGHWQ